MQETPLTQASQIEARYSALFGYGWKRDLAEAIQITLPRLSDQFTNDTVKGAAIVALEFLEATPPARWPARWHKLAARAKAHAKKVAA